MPAKLLIGVLLALLVMLQVALWGGHGLPALWELRELNRVSEIENDELRGRNRALSNEISGMKSGLGAIEEKAREELGMIGQDETFFRVIRRAPGEAPLR